MDDLLLPSKNGPKIFGISAERKLQYPVQNNRSLFLIEDQLSVTTNPRSDPNKYFCFSKAVLPFVARSWTARK
jgi:hypothetical protein